MSTPTPVVFARPTGLCEGARAMHRVQNALIKHAPSHLSFTTKADAADLHIVHVISADAINYCIGLLEKGKRLVIIQYCLATTGLPIPSQWRYVWQEALTVWSYYDLQRLADFAIPNFYHAPLGIDDVFLNALAAYPNEHRQNRVITTGYVDGGAAEAISEVWEAANHLGISAIHIGPNDVAGMETKPDNWLAVEGITDDQLAKYYRTSKWVASLRHVEGFELPTIEGAVCGAIPIVFDQLATFHWFSDFARFVPDCRGQELVKQLTMTMRNDPLPFSKPDLVDLRRQFNWSAILGNFWATTLAAYKIKCAGVVIA